MPSRESNLTLAAIKGAQWPLWQLFVVLKVICKTVVCQRGIAISGARRIPGSCEGPWEAAYVLALDQYQTLAIGRFWDIPISQYALLLLLSNVAVSMTPYPSRLGDAKVNTFPSAESVAATEMALASSWEALPRYCHCLDWFSYRKTELALRISL